MKLHTQRDAIREAFDLFCRNYGDDDDLYLPFCPDPQGAIRQIQKIGTDNLTAEQFDQITGTTGWCNSVCGECQIDKGVLVHIGQDSDDPEYGWARLCHECLLKAIKAIEDQVIHGPHGIGTRGKAAK